MKFISIFKTTENTTAATSAWPPWPSCANNPKTLSFRASNNNNNNNMFKTSNSAFVQENDHHLGSSNSLFSSLGDCELDNDPNKEIVAGILRSSDRLFFEPGETNSILEEAKPSQDNTSKDEDHHPSHVEIMEMDSRDPLLDFKVSMEEMIAAHGLKSWECLEDLLTCYLEVNVKSNHDYIVKAFVDLVVNLSLSCDDVDDGKDEEEDDDERCGNSCSCSSAANHHQQLHEGANSFTSPLSFCYSSTCSMSTSPSMEVSSDQGNLVVSEIKSVVESITSCSSSSSSSFSCNA